MAKLIKKNGGTSGVGMTTEQFNQGLAEMIARHAVQLSEFTDTVQIIATARDKDGNPIRFAYGSGDVYARSKAVELWLQKVEECISG